MSDREMRMTWGGTVSATDEATRILAETEPWPGYHLWLGPYPAISRPIAQAALAEALAAFVADALLAFVERP